MDLLEDIDWDEDVNHVREQEVRMHLAWLADNIRACRMLLDMIVEQEEQQQVPVLPPPVLLDDLLEDEPVHPEVPNDPIEDEALPEVVEAVPEVVIPPNGGVVEVPPENPPGDGLVIVEEVAEPPPDPPGVAALREAERMQANRLHTPHRFKYAGVKRRAEHFNAEPDNVAYVPAPCEERTKQNFLWYFTKRRRPKFAEFADADLVNFLRFHAFCVPRTPALIQSLKQRAIRFMADFDMANHSMADVYRIVACSVAAAMVVTPEEELVRETIRSHSNMIEKYQPFFSSGQYRAGFLGYGVRSLV